MIKSFKHKGLKVFFETGSCRGIKVSHKKKLARILTTLSVAEAIEDMKTPEFRLHPLSGDLAGKWAVQVNGNWRVLFEFHDGDAYVLDYKDYH